MTFLASVQAIITAIPGPVWAAFIAFLGVLLTLRVARATLFASLLERRIKWLKTYKKAVQKADKEMADIIFHQGETPPAPEGLFKVDTLSADAHWLFDNTVTEATAKVQAQLKVISTLRITAASKQEGSREAANLVGGAVLNLYDRVTNVTYAAKPFLYVGDVRRSRRIVSAPKRIKGFAVEHSSSAKTNA